MLKQHQMRRPLIIAITTLLYGAFSLQSRSQELPPAGTESAVPSLEELERQLDARKKVRARRQTAAAESANAPNRLTPAELSALKARLASQGYILITGGQLHLALSAAGPERVVDVAMFAMSKRPVTRGEFAEFVAATGYPGKRGNPRREPSFAQTADDPVVNVSWDDAQSYAAWRSEQFGAVDRLPSTLEWEYAARAGDSGLEPWGADPALACRYANFADETYLKGMRGVTDPVYGCSDGFIQTSPVEQFPPNRWGLYDMLGNSWEWVQDCSDANCTRRILRGGSWNDGPRQARPTTTLTSLPHVRLYHYGFRLARSVP